MTDSPVSALPESEVPQFASRAQRVTFFEDRAEVVRSASVRASGGKSWVRVSGVTPFADDRSVRAGIGAGEATILGVRVVRRLDSVRVGDPAELRAAAARTEEAQLERSGRAASVQSERRRLARLEALRRDWAGGVARVPQGLSESQPEWRAGYEALAVESQAALGQLAQARRALNGAEDALQRDTVALEALQGERSRWEAFLEVQLERAPDAAEAELELELTYRTPCALWRPEHLVRLERDSDEAPDGRLVIQTFAVAWQATGEVWEGVEAFFSTARPGRAASAPLLADDLLYTRDKTSEERREVVVAARDETVDLAGLQRGQRVKDELPGVDDGGEPLRLASSEPVTLPSVNQPFRVPTGSRTLPAGLVRILIPERARVAHLRATATLTGELPLLAGPIRLARGEGGREHLVGRTSTHFVAVGELFELGFGADDAVRVRRESAAESDSSWTGGQTRVRSVTLWLSNLSTDVKRVLVKERVPVSELEEVKVSVEAAGWEHEVRDGFLTRLVELPPRGTETLRYGYTLKAGKKVRLPAGL